MSGESSSRKQRILVYLWGASFLLLGFVLILIGLYVKVGETGLKEWVATAVSLLEHLGTALIVLGSLEILLHLPDMTSYFLDRLRESIVQDEYLAKLEPDALENLVERAFRARLNLPAGGIEREGSFLRYFFSDLQRFVREPYREGAHSWIVCSEDPKYPQCFLIEDTTTYTCRAGVEGIQDSAHWSNAPGEIYLEEGLADSDLPNITIKIRLPRNHDLECASGSSDFLTLVAGKRFEYVFEAVGGIRSTRQERKHQADEKLVEIILAQSIEKYKKFDGLIVHIEATYRVLRDRFQTWQMAHPTKGLSLTLKFPPGFEAQVTPFLQSDRVIQEDRAVGFYRVYYDGWALPDSGIAWRFVPNGPAPAPNRCHPNPLRVPPALPGRQ